MVGSFEARRPIREDSLSRLRRPLVALWTRKWRAVNRAEGFAARTASTAPLPALTAGCTEQRNSKEPAS